MKRWFAAVMIAALPFALAAQEAEEGTGTAAGAQVDTTGKGYTAAYVIEAHSGQVLFAENADVALPTASMAKMMTLLITLEEIREGRLQWDSPVTVSPRASRMGGSQVYLRAGSVWPVKNLVIATMVQSANDAATALAEKIAGSNEAFAEIMNERAKELGLKNSTFYDPHGLPNSENPDQIDKMSAHDLAILGKELMKYAFMRQLAVIPEMEFRNGTLERIYNPNHLVNPKRPNYMSDATGIKTGYSGPAGYAITASAKRGDMELISVVMGARQNRGPLSSFGIASRIMNEQFAKYTVAKPVTKGDAAGTVTVQDGRAESVQAVAAQDAQVVIPRRSDKDLKVSVVGGAVKAPVKKGQPVGAIVVTGKDGKELVRVPAVAGADVAKQSWVKSFWPF